MQLRFGIVALTFLGLSCGPHPRQTANQAPNPPSDAPSAALLLGGPTATVFNSSSTAYASPLPSLSAAELARHQRGDDLFEAKFVAGAAPVHAGLGPRFNNISCAGCHLREGRGAPTFSTPSGANLLVMVSLKDRDPRAKSVLAEREPDGPIPVPGIGLQIQDHANADVSAHAKPVLTWIETSDVYGDGTPYVLRRPVVTLTGVGGQTLDPNLAAPIEISLRQPQPVFGLGLLEAISDETLLALASDSRKVPGRINHVWSKSRQSQAMGRFNRKAGKASLKEQAAKALILDMGLTTDLFPLEPGVTTPHPAEVSREELDDLEFYLRTLAVPARRGISDPEVAAGEYVFSRLGCPGCHQSQITTGDSPVAALAHQTIHPYSDLLLHDMGEGLADERAEFTASGREWRTPPLWGIGLAQTVRPYATYLHDGRARTLEEAILWHGGQAEPYRDAFRRLPANDRSALIHFLGSL